jgi:GNAT superfamily N-acetyltransferase
MSSIRELDKSDKSSWLVLWRGYLEFYETDIPIEQTELTWSRLLDSEFNMHGLVIEDGEVISGIVHYSFQNSTWSPNGHCYLEDLFVAPSIRGKGLGRALIDAVYDIAVKNGCSRLYWTTDATNESARKLYDSYTKESGKIQYRIQISSPD